MPAENLSTSSLSSIGSRSEMTSSPESDVVPAVPTPGVVGKSENTQNTTPSPTPSTNGYGSMSLSSVASSASTMTEYDSLLSGPASLPFSVTSDVSTSTTCLSERSETTSVSNDDDAALKPRTTRAVSDLGKLPDPNDVWGDDKEDQEWILLFDSLLKHAGKKLKACECHPDEAPGYNHNHNNSHGSPYSYRKFSTGD